MNVTHSEARRIKTVFAPAMGFTPDALREIHYKLTWEPRQRELLLESCTFAEADELNDGEPVEEMVMEAVRVRSFSRTAQTMAALQRSLNRYMSDKGLSVGEAVVGTPKKSGLFATVTVQFPVSDGQTITVIFHSPDNDKKQITAADEILAFRWLLNKRDITVAVSPEGEADVSLEEVGKRVAMLVEKNMNAFASKQKEIVEQKSALEALQSQVEAAQQENTATVQALSEAQQESARLDGEISAAQEQLSKAADFNTELQAQVDAARAVKAGNAGKAAGDNTDTEDADIKRAQDALVTELTGRGFVKTEDGLDDLLYTIPLGEEVLSVMLKSLAGVGYSIFAGTPSDNKTFGPVKTPHQFEEKAMPKALDWIDKKLAAIKKVKGSTIDNPKELEVEELPALGVATITDIGSENIYIQKDGMFYFCKVTNTEQYEIGEYDFAAKPSEGWTPSVGDTVYFQDAYEDKRHAANFRGFDGDKAVVVWNGSQMAIERDRIFKEDLPVNTDTDTNPDRAEENAALAILDAIVAGSYATSAEMDAALDEAAAKLEALGMMDLYDDRLNAAADALTTKLSEEAAGV